MQKMKYQTKHIKTDQQMDSQLGNKEKISWKNGFLSFRGHNCTTICKNIFYCTIFLILEHYDAEMQIWYALGTHCIKFG